MRCLLKLTNRFKALADKTRLRIVVLLMARNLCVCEITDILKTTQSGISRHLGILKQAGFVREERRGKWVIYGVADKRNKILTIVRRCLKNDPIYPADIAKMKKTLKKKFCPINYRKGIK